MFARAGKTSSERSDDTRPGCVRYALRMVEYTLVYGMRLFHGPASDVEQAEPMRLAVRGQPEEWRVTPHVIEGRSREEIKRQLLRSIDAFFELH